MKFLQKNNATLLYCVKNDIDWLKKINENLSNAAIYVDNGKKITFITNTQMKDTKGDDSIIVAGVWLNQKIDNDPVNLVKSIYPLDSAKMRIANFAQRGKLVIVNKDKADKTLHALGFNTSQRERIISLAKDNIANNAIKVKNDDVKYSLDVDSDGNKLTQQQAEYFKNSKVRDEDGNLLKVYHGTSENFTIFDKTKGRANMDVQGMFFSLWELDAKDYGSNVNAYYINITNPASEQMGYKALRKFQGQNNAGVKAREYLESLGYDGVNNENEEFIAFNSNQIKLADNLTPTENEDVRFSRDVNIDEFDERDYNVINTTGLRGYASLKHEVMTWDDIKYLNQVRCISIKDRFYL